MMDPRGVKSKANNNKTNKNKSLDREKEQVLIISFEILGLTNVMYVKIIFCFA